MVKKITMVVAGAALVAAHCLIGVAAFADSYTQDGKPCPPECVSDSMEIVTWYPSPYNEYEELRLYPKRSAEESQCNSFEQLGLMYYNQDQQALKVCWQDPQNLSYSWKDVPLGISTNSGNVGIGTTEPQRPLEIDGGDRDTYIRLVSSPHNMAGIEISGVGGDWKIERFYPGGYISGDILTFTKMGKGYHMAITADGNVGIGTTNPSANLEVAGSFKTGSMDMVIYTNSETNSGHFAVGVSCGSGGTVLSGGCYDSCAQVDGGAGNTAIVFNYPDSSNSWRCSSRDIDTSCNRTLKAYAICTK